MSEVPLYCVPLFERNCCTPPGAVGREGSRGDIPAEHGHVGQRQHLRAPPHASLLPHKVSLYRAVYYQVHPGMYRVERIWVAALRPEAPRRRGGSCA